MTAEIKVVLFGDDTVGVITEGGMSLFTPTVAVEIAQSLVSVAKEADPYLDVEGIAKAYRESRGIVDTIQ